MFLFFFRLFVWGYVAILWRKSSCIYILTLLNETVESKTMLLPSTFLFLCFGKELVINIRYSSSGRLPHSVVAEFEIAFWRKKHSLLFHFKCKYIITYTSLPKNSKEINGSLFLMYGIILFIVFFYITSIFACIYKHLG